MPNPTPDPPFSLRQPPSGARTAARRWRGGLAVLALSGLAACGGGVYFSIGDGGERPQVTLVVAPTAARAGDTLTLAAGAVDDVGIDQVAFYRRDSGGDVLLHALGPSPRYEIQVQVPAGAAAGSTLRYFARATDVAGQRADSNLVAVQVLP